MKGDKWYGKCVSESDNLTLYKIYELEEETNRTHPMRPVSLIDDNGTSACMFAARFEKVKKPQTQKRSNFEMLNDPEYIIVYTNERYITKETVARFIKKNVLRKIITEKCDSYKSGECNLCFTDKQELEEGCLLAWKLTVGKGKSIKY